MGRRPQKEKITMISKYSYNTKEYPFRELFCALIDYYFIEVIHNIGGFEEIGNEPGADNSSVWHYSFYNHMRNSPFMHCYNKFIASEIKHKEQLVYQKYPTLRISIPNGKSVASYHVDSEYNHPIEEVNIWLPFTDAFGSNSIYIESEPGKKDYTPQEVKYGEYLMFEGGKLSHGNEVNKTGLTRVSIDMRVIRISQFKPSDKKGLAYGKVRDIEGEDAYYSVI